MFRYPSSITFVYYNDLEYGSFFFEKVLDLPLVMDQGFAKVYQVNKTSFLGIVKLKNSVQFTGNTLVSLNTDNVEKEYERVSKLEVFDLTETKHIEQIPLISFFFNDKEGHRFEIQQFVKSEDLKLFN